jgi:hypothetical protein
MESDLQRKVSRLASQVSQQSVVKDNMSIGCASRKVSVFEQISKIEKQKLGRAPFNHYGAQAKTIQYPPTSPALSHKPDFDVMSTGSRQTKPNIQLKSIERK